MGKIFELNSGKCSTELQSNETFARLTSEIKKPESVNSGLSTNYLDSPHESDTNGKYNIPILSDVSNLYKHNGASMENLGYFIIPRSVTSDPRYKGARLKYQKVLHILFENVAFAPTKYAIGCEIIDINVGQFCVAIRCLAEICNDGVKNKEDKIDRNIICRAIAYFEKCQFVRQEVRHGKSIITITIPEFYDRLKRKSETTSETKARQERDSKEEDKEDKEDNIISSSAVAPDSAIASSEKKKISSSSSKKRKKVEAVPLIERDAGIFISDIAHQKLIQEKGSEEIVKKIYSAMAVWKAQNGISGGDDYKTAVKWTLTPQRPSSTYQKIQPKYNHDTSPRNPKHIISFAEEV